jgi:hypothetical protein
LLEEERVAVINQAVTKGLDPNVSMKDSGIEWLGQIPKHWEVNKIKSVTKKIGSGVTPKGGAEIYELTGIPLLRSQNVYFDGFRLDNLAYITREIHDYMKNSQVLFGDVLLNITGGSGNPGSGSGPTLTGSQIGGTGGTNIFGANGSPATAASGVGGGGGGAGGVAIVYLSGLTPGNTISVTRGAGGNGAPNTGNSGTNGAVLVEY